MRRVRYLIFLGGFWAVISANAQQPALKFSHYGKEEGLNQSSVNAIYQDSQGILWVANFGGINSFDGYTFKSFVHDFKDSTSIPDNSVWDIFEDQQNRLWFGTKSSLSLLDRDLGNFRNFYIQKPDVNTLAVKVVYQTKDGRLLVGSEGKGLYEFDLQSQEFILQTQFPDQIKVTAISEDAQGNLWVATENSGLYVWDSELRHYKLFQGLDLTTVWSLYAQPDGQVWIGTDVEGLLSWDPTDQEIKKWSQLNTSYASGDKIKTIKPGTQGRLWIGSATHGLSIYDPQSDRFYSYTSLPGAGNSLFDDDVSDIAMGHNGVIWVGMYMNGFDKVITTPFSIIRHHPNLSNSLSNNNVYCMYRDRQGALWFGTFGGGLNRYHTNTGDFTHYRHDPDNPRSISHDWVRILFEDSQGTFWVGTWGGGLNKFDRRQGTFKRYLPDPNNPDNSLNLNIITALFEDSRGDLWVGTYGGGINIYQPQTDDFRSLRHSEADPNSLSDDHITSFYEDQEGYLWVCTYGGGISKYDYQTGKFERFIPDPQQPFSLNNHKVLHIFPDPDSTHWWITTLGGGINKFYPQENKFEGYTINEGLADNTTMGMLKDHRGYWISTNTGLSHLDLEDYTFTNYTTVDGLASDDFNLEAYLIDRGNFYFGSKQGVTVFDPQQVVAESSFPDIRVTEVKVNGEPSTYKSSEELSVPFNKRLSLEFAAINPSKVENIQYSYILEGLDQQWQQVGKRRIVEFASLNPGNYTFKVRSTNGSKIWNDEFYQLRIHIPPPWYMTWYFRVGAILLVILLGVSYYLRKVNILKKRQQVLEDTVAARTQTIAEKNKDLKESYQKLKNLESFKDSMVHMIAHDLKNPLVTILGTSELNQNAQHMDQIHKSGKDMLILIENMLDVQKFEKENIQLQLQIIPLAEVIDEVIRESAYSASRKEVNINNEVNPDILVKVDLALFKRVILNLLTNALKFSHFGSNIDLRAVTRDDRVEIAVKDYGEGITKDAQKTIFEKYTQDKVRGLGATKSTGLGLAFCKLVIQAHGGEIKVDSEPNEGATFFFDVAYAGMDQIDLRTTTNQQVEVSHNGPELTDEDLEYLHQNKAKIEALEVYQTGEWLNLLDSFKVNSSTTMQSWCQQVEQVLIHMDEAALNRMKESLQHHWSKLSQS